MGRIGCNLEGYLNDSKFSEPMPWIGIYVAAASLVCLLAMGVDAYIGITHRKFWFPCIYFSLNSTSLTILAAAIKLPMDLNSSMPRAHDQLSKLSSSALICVAMGNFMPSRDIKKSWMMARTSNPQYVMARLATTASSGAACLLSALILAEAMARSRWHAGSFKLEIKECPFAVQIRARPCRKFVHELKNQCINMCIRAQMGVVLVSKLVQLASTILFNQVCILHCTINRMHQILQPQKSASNEERRPKCEASKKLDLNHFVLYLEGEEKLVELIASKSNDATECRIKEGRKRKPTYLLELLNKSTMSDGFTRAREFNSDKLTTLDSKEPSSSWSLAVVTLTGIAIALPNIDKNQIEWLLQGVSQGLKYVRIIEKFLDGKERTKSSRKAADIMWIEIDIYKQWLGTSLCKLAGEGKSPKEILEGLAQIGNNHLMDFKKYASSCGKGIDSIEWPHKVVAANSMQRHSLTLLMIYRNSNHTTDKLFEWLCQTISDTLGACLSNLPYAISAKCFSHGNKKVEKNVYGAARLLGEAEEILKFLSQHSLPELNSDENQFMENWQFLMKQKTYLLPSTTSENNV